jgi:hypothetical protein
VTQLRDLGVADPVEDIGVRLVSKLTRHLVPTTRGTEKQT